MSRSARRDLSAPLQIQATITNWVCGSTTTFCENIRTAQRQSFMTALVSWRAGICNWPIWRSALLRLREEDESADLAQMLCISLDAPGAKASPGRGLSGITSSGDRLLPHRILSVSYDEPLLKTRALLLKQRADYKVTSALGFTAARELCSSAEFDLFILGHSIPAQDKRELIHCFRKRSNAPILALRKMGETIPDGADEHVDPNDIEALLRMVEALTTKQ